MPESSVTVLVLLKFADSKSNFSEVSRSINFMSFLIPHFKKLILPSGFGLSDLISGDLVIITMTGILLFKL